MLVKGVDVRQSELGPADPAAVHRDVRLCLRKILVPVAVGVQHEGTVGVDRHTCIARVAGFCAGCPVIVQTDTVLTLVALHQILIGAHPGHPLTARPIAETAVGGHAFADHLPEGNDQPSADGVVERLVPLAIQRALHLHRLAPGLSLVIRPEHHRHAVVGLSAGQSHDPVAVRGAEHSHLADLLGLFHRIVFLQITFRRGPLHIALLVKGQISLVVVVAQVVANTHPLVDEITVLILELHKARHCHDRV